MLDFIQFIDDNAALTTEQKAALLDDFCETYNYQETVEDQDGNPIPNPVSKREFANTWATKYFVDSVNSVRKQRAEQAATWEELTLETA